MVGVGLLCMILTNIGYDSDQYCMILTNIV